MQSLNLQLNFHKCCVLNPSPADSVSFNSKQSIIRFCDQFLIPHSNIKFGSASFLGSCVGFDQGLLSMEVQKDFNSILSFQQYLLHPLMPKQIAIFLLRSHMLASVTHFLRTLPPSVCKPACILFDASILSLYQKILRFPLYNHICVFDAPHQFCNTLEASLITCLPYAAGGLGFVRTQDISDIAFFSAYALLASVPSISSILPSSLLPNVSLPPPSNMLNSPYSPLPAAVSSIQCPFSLCSINMPPARLRTHLNTTHLAELGHVPFIPMFPKAAVCSSCKHIFMGGPRMHKQCRAVNNLHSLFHIPSFSVNLSVDGSVGMNTPISSRNRHNPPTPLVPLSPAPLDLLPQYPPFFRHIISSYQHMQSFITPNSPSLLQSLLPPSYQSFFPFYSSPSNSHMLQKRITKQFNSIYLRSLLKYPTLPTSSTARILSRTAPHASSFHTVIQTSQDLILSNDAYTRIHRFLIGLPYFSSVSASSCSCRHSLTSSFVDHPFQCRKLLRYVTLRHDTVNKLLKSFADDAGVTLVLEPPVSLNPLVPRIRPDGLYYSSATDFHYFDFSVVSPSLPSFSNLASNYVLSACQSRCSSKTSKFLGWSLPSGANGFSPFVVESYGGVSTSLRQFFRFLTDQLSSSLSASASSSFYRSMMLRFSVALHRLNSIILEKGDHIIPRSA